MGSQPGLSSWEPLPRSDVSVSEHNDANLVSRALLDRMATNVKLAKGQQLD